ncbi:MAG: GNAT family protein [Planctomycetota bacterium]|nr:GNAT family protein [Planctomycetota bacterium]
MKPREFVVEGPRVGLRAPREADREAWDALRRASGRFHTRWEPRVKPGPGVPRDAFDRFLKDANTSERERLLIVDRATGALLGYVGLGNIIRGPFQSAFIGYWIGKPFAGRGYMTEALGLMLRHSFVNLKLHRVEANIQPGNEPSKRTALAAGLRLEGYSPRYLKIAGVWADHERYALTVEDWRASLRTRRGSGRLRA